MNELFAQEIYPSHDAPHTHTAPHNCACCARPNAVPQARVEMTVVQCLPRVPYSTSAHNTAVNSMAYNYSQSMHEYGMAEAVQASE